MPGCTDISCVNIVNYNTIIKTNGHLCVRQTRKTVPLDVKIHVALAKIVYHNATPNGTAKRNLRSRGRQRKKSGAAFTMNMAIAA